MSNAMKSSMAWRKVAPLFMARRCEVMDDDDSSQLKVPTRNVVVVLPDCERDQRAIGVPLLQPIETITQ